MSSSRIFDIERPLIMAHRGDSGNTPENTMIALENAVEIGVDVLESDLHLTKDDEIVLFHDEDLKRTTGKEGTIRSHTLDELMEIDLGIKFTRDNGDTYPFRGKGHKIVTLREAFDKFPNVIFNLDIKDTFLAAPTELARIISKMNQKDSVIVASFHDHQLERFRELSPEVLTSAHPGEVKRFVLNSKFGFPRIKRQDIQYRAFQVPIKSGPLTVVTKKFVRKAHELDLAVHVWTINDETTMNYLLDLGIDGIFTDQPVLLRKVLQKRGLL
ncbi:MAG: glycerophosphodiester phosphodiesterase [Candidatus Thorarchaeota archaeon]